MHSLMPIKWNKKKQFTDANRIDRSADKVDEKEVWLYVSRVMILGHPVFIYLSIYFYSDRTLVWTTG